MVRPAHTVPGGDPMAEAVAHARASASVLSDPLNIENDAIFAWLDRHRLGRYGGRWQAVGSDLLPVRWRERTRRFASLSAAQQFTRHFQTSSASVTAMRRALETAERQCLVPMQPAQLALRFAEQLLRGRVWVVEVRKMRQPVGKTSPQVYTTLNGLYGTAVDFGYLARWEGGQYLRGYVPIVSKTGRVAGKSGMTIATGFDIGQLAPEAFDALFKGSAVSAGELAAMRPFTNARLTNMTRQAVAEWVARTAPMPILTPAGADEVDRVVHGDHLAAAIRNWNSDRLTGVPAFRDLPAAWQTVLFSRHFHQGKGMPGVALSKPFWRAATAGHWAEAVQALKAYPVTEDWYRDRVRQEAALLAGALPAAVPAAPAAKTAAKSAPGTPPATSVPPRRLP